MQRGTGSEQAGLGAVHERHITGDLNSLANRGRGECDSSDARASAVECHCQVLPRLVGPGAEARSV